MLCREALRLAQLQSQQGLVDGLNVLDAQRQLFAAQIALTPTQRAEFDAKVQLYRALGGGWAPEGSKPPTQAER
jgi:outer membrane protein, multidrug efflux system